MRQPEIARRYRRTVIAALVSAAFVSTASAAPVTWVGPNASFWDLAGNWNPGLPGAADDALLGAFDTTFRSGTVTIQSFSGTGTLSITGGSLTNTLASSTSGLNLTGGTLNVGGPTNVVSYTHSGGILTGPGTFTITGAGTWTGGGIEGVGGVLAVASGATLALSGATAHDTAQRTFDLGGTTTWTNVNAGLAGAIRTGSGVQFNNSGLFQDQTEFNTTISQVFGGAASTFTNTGTYAKTGAGTTTISIAFNNTNTGTPGTGVVNVDAGVLRLVGGGTSNGSFSILAGTTLEFGGSIYNLNNAAATSSSGRILVSGGTVNTTGTLNVDGLLELTGGTLNVGGPTNVVSYTHSGGILTGPGTFTITGAGTWTGGGIEGVGGVLAVASGATLALSGATAHDTAQRTFDLGGTTTWTNVNAGLAGAIRTGSGVQFNNSGLFQDQTEFNTTISQVFGGAASTFTNTGTYAKTGAGTTTISIAFNNTNTGTPGTGVVNVDAGVLRLVGGGTSNGSFSILAGTTLEFGGSIYNLNNAAATSSSGRILVSGGTVNTTGTLNVDGLLELTGGTLNVGGPTNVVSYTHSGGILTGPGTFTITGAGTWTGGGIEGVGGVLAVASGATLALSGATAHDTAQRTFDLGGTTTWTNVNAGLAGAIRTGSGVQFNNSGLFQDQTEFNTTISQVFGGAASTFTNTGTYAKTGAGTTTISIAFNNTNTGTPGTGVVNVDAGVLRLVGGGTSNGSFSILAGTTLEFGGSIYNLNNAAATSSSGRILVSGGTVNTTGTLNVDGLLELTGGTLNVGGPTNVVSYTHSGGILTGPGTFTITGAGTWTGGGIEGVGGVLAVASGATLALSGATAHDTAQRTFDLGGTTTWTNVNAGLAGAIRTGSGVQFNNSGLFQDQTEFNTTISQVFGGAASTFTNTGTYAKTGAGTTTISIAFNNTNTGTPGTGVVNVDAGVLRLVGGGTSNGSFSILAGTTLEFGGSIYNLNNAAATSSSGRILVSGGTVNTTGTLNVDGLLELTGGTLNVGGPTNVVSYTHSGGILTGPGTFTITGAGTWTGGGIEGVGGVLAVASGATLALSGATAHDTAQRTFDLGGTTTWTNVNAGLAGAIRTGSGVQFNNSGLFQDQTGFNTSISQAFGGAPSAFTNTGTYAKTGAGTTTIGLGFSNPGTVDVSAGTLSLASVTQHVGTSLTGGTWIASDGTLTFTTGSNITTNQGNVTLSGAASVFARINAIADNQGTFTIQNGRTFTTAGALTNSGTATAGVGGTLNFAGAVTNSGSLVSSGVMTATAAITGAGVVQINPGGQINLGGASTAATLINNGTTANALNLGANNITVSNDYQNANFGSGNSFNRRTNVAGAGLILSSHATPNLQQSLSGNIAGGTTTGNATMAFGNVHVGEAVTRNYEVNNAAGGPILRGAIQTTANGGNLTDARLTGTGVTAGNFGPLAAGAGSGNLAVTLLAPVSGPINLLGQQVALVNNFDNTNSQLLSITAGGAYAFASPSAATPSPVSFGSVRLGTTASQALSMTNTDVALAGFQEALNASISTASAGVNASGSFNGLGQGATNNTSLVVGIDTASVGNKSGTATIALQSDGAGTSGLGITALPSQIVDISGTVWRVAAASAATPNPIAFTNARVGDLKTQALTIGNTAAADGFSEGLRASIGGATGNVSVNGATGLIAAGGNGGGMSLTLDTSAAGARSGSATITLQSDGAGTSGLAPIGIGTQTVNASGNVYQVAQPSAVTPNPLVLANQRVGGTLAQALTLTNTSDAPVGFQEALNAAFSGTTGGAIANGAINLLGQGVTNNTSLLVGVNTATAGAKSGTATLGLTSDGTGTSGLGTLALTSQIVNVTGNVYNAAVGSTTPSPAVVANQRVGGAGGVALTVNNTAPGGLFSEALNAAFAAPTGDATHNGGGVSNLIAGGSNNSAMNVGVSTATAGAKSGTVTLNYQTDGTGANGNSGLAAIAAGNQVITVSGNVYQVAQPTLASNTISFANRHVGAAATQALSLTNTSAAPAGFQEALNANFSGNTGAATSSGSVTGLAQGASNTTNLLVGLDTSTAGAKSGTATLALASNGAGTSGLAPLGLTDQLVTVSGNVYRLAQALLTNPLSFGNVLVGSGPTTRNVSITNTALNDGFSEALNASFGTLTNTGVGSLSSAGAINLLGAGQTNNTSMQVTLNPTAQGTVSATVQILLASDGTGTSGLGVTALPNQVLTIDGLITANAGILAQASAATPNPVSFGKFRVGGPAAPTQTLSIQNVAAGAAEGLNASIGTGSAGFTAAGAFTGLAPGATNATSLNVGFTDTATAGAKSGTATITLASDGSFNAGVTTALPSQTVNMSAEVYRLAQAGVAAPNPITFNNARVGDVRTQALTIGNTALNDGFSEGLRASIGSATGNVSVAGATGLIAAGNSGTGMSATLDTSAAGARSGSATITLQSDGAGTSGFGTLGIGTQTLNVAGNVYQLAAGTLNSAPLNFGTVQVGQAVSQTLSISNSALGPSGFVEDLNARFGTTSGTGAAAIGGTGQIAGLSAGATNATNMVVSVNTSTAQTINGAIAVDFFSAGTVNGVSNALGELGVGSTPFAVSGLIEAAGTVIDQARPVTNGTANPAPVAVSLGNVRIGATATQSLSVQNQATGGAQAALNASIASNGAPITAAGSFNLLAPGATNTSALQVGMDTAAAGAKSGSATIGFVSDASNVGGCAPSCELNLPSQTVNVSGAVYRLASPVLNTANVSLAARVGDAAPSGAISVTNSSPDVFTEGLKASLGATPAGFTGSGSIANLVAGGTDASSLRATLNTAVAGSFGGPLEVSFVSTGEGTTGAADLALGSAPVTLSGKVYTPAVAQVAGLVDFGIVHKGEAVATRNVAVANSAALSALNDVLRGSFGGAGAAFAASGNLGAGLIAGAGADTTSFNVALSTANAGVFNGTATATLASHNADLADLGLADAQVTLTAQVNNFANAALVKRAGEGTLGGGGLSYTLDLGSILRGTGLHRVTLGVLNDVLGPADLLDGEFDLGLVDEFALAGFDPFADLAAGVLQEGLVAALDTDLLSLGTYVDTIVLSALVGHNASGFSGRLEDITLVLRAQVIEATGVVPEPGTLALLVLGMVVLMRRMRRVPR